MQIGIHQCSPGLDTSSKKNLPIPTQYALLKIINKEIWEKNHPRAPQCLKCLNFRVAMSFVQSKSLELLREAFDKNAFRTPRGVAWTLWVSPFLCSPALELAWHLLRSWRTGEPGDQGVMNIYMYIYIYTAYIKFERTHAYINIQTHIYIYLYIHTKQS